MSTNRDSINEILSGRDSLENQNTLNYFRKLGKRINSDEKHAVFDYMSEVTGMNQNATSTAYICDISVALGLHNDKITKSSLFEISGEFYENDLKFRGDKESSLRRFSKSYAALNGVYINNFKKSATMDKEFLKEFPYFYHKAPHFIEMVKSLEFMRKHECVIQLHLGKEAESLLISPESHKPNTISMLHEYKKMSPNFQEIEIKSKKREKLDSVYLDEKFRNIGWCKSKESLNIYTDIVSDFIVGDSPINGIWWNTSLHDFLKGFCNNLENDRKPIHKMLSGCMFHERWEERDDIIKAVYNSLTTS